MKKRFVVLFIFGVLLAAASFFVKGRIESNFVASGGNLEAVKSKTAIMYLPAALGAVLAIIGFIRMIVPQKSKGNEAEKNEKVTKGKGNSGFSRAIAFIFALLSVILQIAAIGVAITQSDDLGSTVSYAVFLFLIGVFIQAILYGKVSGKKTGVITIIGYVVYGAGIVSGMIAAFDKENFVVGLIVAYILICVGTTMITGRSDKTRSNASPAVQGIGNILAVVLAPFVSIIYLIIIWIPRLLPSAFIVMGRAVSGKSVDGVSFKKDKETAAEIEAADDENEKRMSEIEEKGREYIKQAARYGAERLDIDAYTSCNVKVDCEITSLYVLFTYRFDAEVNLREEKDAENVFEREKRETEAFVQEYINKKCAEHQAKLGNEWRVEVQSETKINAVG